MTTSKFLLSFEMSKDGDELDVHCDEIGLEKLKAVISQLEDREQHYHLMTESWGGNELSEEPQSEDGNLINKVTIHRW